MSEAIRGVRPADGRHEDAHEDRGPEHELAGLVMMTARRLRRARMEALRPYGLTPQQAGAFLVVARRSRGHHHHGHDGLHRRGEHAEIHGHEEPGENGHHDELRLTDLARRLRIAPRSVTEVVDALCEKGLVARRPSPTDRRATIVTLTEGGERLHSDLVERRDGAADLFAPLTADEQDQLRALLRRLHEEEERPR